MQGGKLGHNSMSYLCISLAAKIDKKEMLTVDFVLLLKRTQQRKKKKFFSFRSGLPAGLEETLDHLLLVEEVPVALIK